jgi:hypothetical protein
MHQMRHLLPLFRFQPFARCGATVLSLVLTTMLAILPTTANAWTPGLKEAAEAVARGTASMEQQMMVFLNNQEVNLMGIKGTISKDVYTTCQTNFESLNTKFATRAVEEAGFQTDFKQRSAQAKINPGTDTDVNFRATSGRNIGLEDLKKIENNYQRIVRQHFESQKLNVPEGRINTDTDFLPDPGQMSPQEFKKCAEHINSGGGTAYKSPEAVRAQMKLDGQSTAPVDLDEAISFTTEGKELARHKLSEARALRKDAAAVRKANPGLAERLEAQAQLYESQASKYASRIEDVNNNLRRSHDLPELPKTTTTIDGQKVLGGLDRARDNIKTLNRGTQTANDAAAMRALDDHLLQKATDQTIDTLAEIAKLDPRKANQARRAIAAELNSLPPAKAGEALQRLEKTLGPNFTKSIANESRKLAQVSKPVIPGAVDRAGLSAADRAADKFARIGVKAVKIGIIAGGAYFMGKDGVYHALEQTEATDTELDFFYKVYKNAAWYGTGIGYAYEEAEKEELARYLREVEAGRDPGIGKHVLFTLLKTPYLMGRDIAVGILYLPDALIEAITGAKEAEAKEQAAKEFLAAVRLAVLNKKETEKAQKLARDMGVRPEDEKAFLDCMCRDCGGSLGGFFNPACTSDIGHGPCQCNGPLTIWKTPLPTGSNELQYKCFNSITQMHYNQAQAVFNKWRQRMRDENFNSAKKYIIAIQEHIGKGEFIEAADRFKGIRELIDGAMVPGPGDGSSRNLSYELSTNITNGLLQQAREHAADPALTKPLAQSVRKATKAREVNPKNEEINKRVAQYQQWEKGWNEVIATKLPEIKGLIDKGHIKTAGERFGHVQMGINQGRLPPRHRDPQMVALEELLRQKRRPDAFTVTLSTPSAQGSRPQIWQCRSAKDCGMVTVGADTFVTGEAVTVQAGITPRVDDVFYVWTVAPIPPGSLNCTTEPKDNRMTLRCPARGKYLVSVRGQSGDTSVLGHASQRIIVGVDAAEVAAARQQQADYEAAKKPGRAQLHLPVNTVAPKTTLPLKWSATGNIPDTAWISLVPGNTPHKDIRGNDRRTLSLQRIGPVRSGTMQFTAPDSPGVYELRFNDPTSGRELAKVAFKVELPNPLAPPPPPPVAKMPPPVQPPPQKASPPASTTPYGSALPLAGEWQVNFNGWQGTLTFGADGSAVLRLPTTAEPLRNIGYKTSGEVTFTRPLPGTNQQQVYTGLVSGNTARGTFDCTTSGKGYSWTMTRSSGNAAKAAVPPNQSAAPAAKTATPTAKASASTAQTAAPAAKAAASTVQTTAPAAKADTSSLPSGWQQITLGYLQFGIPGSWKHNTASESWVERLHLYWQGNFDNPEHGITCGVVTDYNRAKEEMGGGSTTTVAGMTVLRQNDGENDLLLFPPRAGTQGVVLMFYSGSGSGSPKDAIIKTIRALK